MQVANIRRGIACVAVPKGNLMTLDWDNTNCVNCELLKWHLSGCRTNNTLQNYIPIINLYVPSFCVDHNGLTDNLMPLCTTHINHCYCSGSDCEIACK